MVNKSYITKTHINKKKKKEPLIDAFQIPYQYLLLNVNMTNQTLFHFFHQVKKRKNDSTIQYLFFILQDLKPNKKYKNITLNQDCNCHGNLLSQTFNS